MGCFLSSVSDFTFINSVINDRYKILKQIGSGGMGDVFLAEHILLKKKVAIKILHYDQSLKKNILERFKREAIAASNVGQSNIADVTDFGYTKNGQAFLVMEYVDGVSLSELLKEEGALPLHQALSIASQIALALYFAHGKGIIHRDLKPENILITTKEGIYPFAKLVDFGISKIVGDKIKRTTASITQSGSIFGTPEYMSPEQAGGNKVSFPTDIYSLGVVFYEMLTGQIPFSDDNYMKILQKHLYETPKLPSEVNPDLPKEIDNIVMKCLEKEPEKRYGSMLDFVTDMKVFYKKHGLERKQSLAFVFNSTAIVDLSLDVIEENDDFDKKKNKSLTNNDVLRILNKGTVVNPNKSEFGEDEYKKSNKKAWGLFFFIILLLIATSISTYLFFFNKKPMVVERIVKTTKPVNKKKPDIKKKKKIVKRYHKPVFVRKRRYITLRVLSNVKNVVVFNKENRRKLCTTPCKIRLRKDDSKVLLLGFQKEGYNIQPKAIRLNQDMKLTVNLN